MKYREAGAILVITRKDSEYYGKRVKLIRKVGREWIAILMAEAKKGLSRKELKLLEQDIGDCI